MNVTDKALQTQGRRDLGTIGTGGNAAETNLVAGEDYAGTVPVSTEGRTAAGNSGASSATASQTTTPAVADTPAIPAAPAASATVTAASTPPASGNDTAAQVTTVGGDVVVGGANGTLSIVPPSLPLIEASAALGLSVMHGDGAKASSSMQGGLLAWVDSQIDSQPGDLPPLWDFFSLDEQQAKELSKSAPRLLQEAVAAKKFREAWKPFAKDAITGKATGDGTLEGLKAFVEERKEARLSPGQRTLILKRFMDFNAFGDAASFYEHSKSVDARFASYEIPAEYYIVCLNKTKRLLESAQTSQAYLAERVKTNQKLASRGHNRWETYRAIGINGEIFGGLGKAFKTMWQKAQKGPLSPDELTLIAKENNGLPADPGKTALQLSTQYYEAGFAVDFEYYPGINAVYNNMTLGNFDRAERLAPMVWQACQSEGGKKSNDYWCLITMLEVALINKDDGEAADMVPRVLNRVRADWEISTSADNMEMLAAQRRDKGENPKMLDYVAIAMRDRIKMGFPPPADFDEKAWIAQVAAGATALAGETPQPENDKKIAMTPVTSAVDDKSFHFRGISSRYVEGSVPYGGLLPDISVNRTSIRIARQILSDLKLSGVTDYDTWNGKVDRYINERFALDDPVSGTRPHENLRSPEHKKRDMFRRNLLYFTHAFESGDGRSNAVAELLLGEGDCRHVAYCAKQLLYDVWKRDNQTRVMQSGFDAVMNGNAGAYDQALDKVAALEREQLVTFSVRLRAPVQMVKYYEWRTDEQGRPLPHPDGQIQDVEDHTFNALCRRPDGVNVERITANDSFYKVLYPLGNREFKPDEILDETNGFFAGHLGIPSADNEAIPFWALPTRFSGRQHKASEDECGEVLLGGAPLASPDPNLFMQHRDKFQHLVEAVTTMVVGKLKAKVLDAMLTTMLDQAGKDAHGLWREARTRDKNDNANPYLGYGKQPVIVTDALRRMSYEQMHKALSTQAPGVALSPQKYDTIRQAPLGSTVLDPRDQDHDTLLKTQMDGGTRLAGEFAVPPLALALYLHDFRHGEDLRLVLQGLMEGTDKPGAADLLKINRTAFLAAQFMHGERSYENTVAAMEPSGKQKELAPRADFQAFHALHQDIAALDEYTLRPAATWLLQQLQQDKSASAAALLQRVIGDLVESSAADAHNVGWKVAKDKALADPNNCFLGWAPKRVRSSAELRGLSREELASKLQVAPDRITDDKLNAIRNSKDGQDLTHHWYKPYVEVLGAEVDGGMRLGGQNALPLLVLGLYLTDFRDAESMSPAALEQTLQGLLNGSDKAGLEKLSMLMHVAFQSGQLVYGERAQKNVIEEMQRGEGTVELPENPRFTSLATLAPGLRTTNAAETEPSLAWLNANLERMKEA